MLVMTLRSLSTPLTVILFATLTGSIGCKLTIGGDAGDDIGDGDGDTDSTADSTTDATDTTTDSTDSTGDGDGDPTNPPPDTCTPAEEGFAWCTHSDTDGPEGSAFYVCKSGVWVESAATMNDACVTDGYDFAYGCVDDGTMVVFECGEGSGTACGDADPAYCVDGDQIGYCQWGKDTWDSCLSFCQDVGIDGVTYEYGECDDSVADVACFCCDSGDPGCPI